MTDNVFKTLKSIELIARKGEGGGTVSVGGVLAEGGD